jgi:hypothetical protein
MSKVIHLQHKRERLFMARNRKNNGSEGQSIIANMGLFWDRDKVRWKQPKEGLCGIRIGAKRDGKVDFWPQTGIYALYDMDYNLVYVGQAGFGDKTFIGNRLKAHTTDTLAGRWIKFSWFGLRKVTKEGKLGNRPEYRSGSLTWIGNVLEAMIIEVAEPPMNSQKGKFGPNVTRYIQPDKITYDEIADIDTEKHKEIIQKISKSHDKIMGELGKLKKAIRAKRRVIKVR